MWYTCAVKFARKPEPATVNPALYVGVDLGVNNLATIASNKAGFVPVIVNSRPLKASNQGYNKQRAVLQSRLAAGQYTTRRLDRLTDIRHSHYAGKRVKRGLFRAANGRYINADVNGAYNIIRKVAPDAFAQGSSGCVVHPVRLAA